MYGVKYLKISLLIAVMSGCSISDPKEGGLIGGLIGLGFDRYERNTQELEAELTKTKSDARRTNEQVQLSAIEVECEHREVVELREAVGRTVENTRGFTVVPEQINDSPDIQQAKADLVKRIQALSIRVTQLQQANLTTTEDCKKVELLKEEVQKINEELEALWQSAEELR